MLPFCHWIRKDDNLNLIQQLFPWLCFFFQMQVRRRRTVQWWNQVKEAWSPTATGRRKRPSLEGALCHWGRNSPQVHLMMLSLYLVLQNIAWLVVFLCWKSFTWASPNLLSFICRSISHAHYIYAYWWCTFSCLLMFYSLSSSVQLHPSHSPRFFLSNGFKWPHWESNKRL